MSPYMTPGSADLLIVLIYVVTAGLVHITVVLMYVISGLTLVHITAADLICCVQCLLYLSPCSNL